MNNILLVDDEQHIRELIRIYLEKEGFIVIEAIDGVDALNKLSEVKIDLVIMDIMMPNMDGFELCKKIRSYYDELPILMLTAKGEVEEKIKGFNLGTDDYMVKPFEPVELVVRVKSLMKRYKIAVSKLVEVGNIVLDSANLEIRIGNEVMILPLKEFELLFKLASYPKKTFTREQLIEEIWGFDYEGDERTVDVHIKRIRERFTEANGFRITTVRGLGYRLELLEV